MREPFTTEEVKYAINKLKNNKSAGLDDIQAEHLKRAPNIIMEKIAEIFNEMTITGNFPNEITQGILIPLQKQGKEKGYIKNTRPIILLNTIRKILAIIMLKRIINKLNEEIPLTQSAYRSGRSTTENVFVLRTLIDKALSLTNYELNILFLDMSKAFDSIDREILLEDLNKILDADELHIKILIKDVTLIVRNGKTFGTAFNTTKGIPQGDSLSPILFTLYLANSLKQENINKNLIGNEFENVKQNDHDSYTTVNTVSENLLPTHLQDHNYDRKQNKIFSLDQQFADDINWITNNSTKLNEIEGNVTLKLKKRGLLINESKTEKLRISKDGNMDWKQTKYLGSYLDTEKDLNHRKQLCMFSYLKNRNKLESKRLSIKIKMRIFNAFVTSIFLYNSELWITNTKLNNKINVFQRSLLRRILNIRYPKIISNAKLYQITKEKEWSNTIKCRRLKWTGHLMRLPDKTPAKLALEESLKSVGIKNIGKRSFYKTWIGNTELDITQTDKNLTMNHIYEHGLADDREKWKNETVRKASTCHIYNSGCLDSQK